MAAALTVLKTVCRNRIAGFKLRSQYWPFLQLCRSYWPTPFYFFCLPFPGVILKRKSPNIKWSWFLALWLVQNFWRGNKNAVNCVKLKFRLNVWLMDLLLGPIHKQKLQRKWSYSCFKQSAWLTVWPDWAIFWTLGKFLKPLETN